MKPGPSRHQLVCQHCGLESAASIDHASARECIAALEREVHRLRECLRHGRFSVIGPRQSGPRSRQRRRCSASADSGSIIHRPSASCGLKADRGPAGVTCVFPASRHAFPNGSSIARIGACAISMGWLSGQIEQWRAEFVAARRAYPRLVPAIVDILPCSSPFPSSAASGPRSA